MGDLDRAFATWAELEQFALKPDAGTYNALLHTCIRTRELASGRRLLSRMGQDGIAPNAATFTHQCALHIMSKEEDLAFGLLQQCKDLDIVPSGKMYASIINMLVRRRDGAGAKVALRHQSLSHPSSRFCIPSRRLLATSTRSPLASEPLAPRTSMCSSSTAESQPSLVQAVLDDMQKQQHFVGNGLKQKVQDLVGS